MTATGAVPVPPIRKRNVDLYKPGTIARVVLTVALIGLLVYFIGISDIAATILKVVISVGVSMGIIVGLNLLFNLVYDKWTLFLTIVGFVIGFVTFVILDGDRVLRELEPRPWAWAVIGGLAGAGALFLIGAVREPVPRLWLGLAAFAGVGVVVAVAIDETDQPGLDWAKLLVCTAIGVAIGAGLALLRRRTHRQTVFGAALVGGAIGWLIGAWGGADLGSGSLGEALIATVIPLAAIGARLGMSPLPDDEHPAGDRGTVAGLDLCDTSVATGGRGPARSARENHHPLVQGSQQRGERRLDKLRRRHLLASTGGH